MHFTDDPHLAGTHLSGLPCLSNIREVTARGRHLGSSLGVAFREFGVMSDHHLRRRVTISRVEVVAVDHSYQPGLGGRHATTQCFEFGDPLNRITVVGRAHPGGKQGVQPVANRVDCFSRLRQEDYRTHVRSVPQ